MSDLKLITDRMMEKKKAEVQEHLKATEAEAEALLQAADQDIAEAKAKQKTEIDARLQRQFTQRVNAIQNDKRNQLLAEKQSVLMDTFKTAQSEMESWESLKFQSFLLSVLKQFKSTPGIELVMGENSVSHVNNKWIEEKAKKEVDVSLSTETVARKSGFVIRHQGIEYNYFFDALIEEMKNQLLPEVSQKLFS